MRFRLVDERRLQGTQLRIESVDGLAHPEAEVGRHLVVARARRMQAPGRLADELGKARLDVHMDVLERRLEGELAAFDLSRNRV